jgi:hypothetical protein
MSGGRHEHEPSIADSFITVTEAQLAHLALEAETMERQRKNQALDTAETTTPSAKHYASRHFIQRSTLAAVIDYAMRHDTPEMPVRIDTIALIVGEDTYTDVTIATTVPFRRRLGTYNYRPDTDTIYKISGNSAAVAFAEMYGKIQDWCDTSDGLRLIRTDQTEPPQS